MLNRSSPQRPQYLFVYGSLMTGQRAHHLLVKDGLLEQVANQSGFAVPGELYKIGRYPALRDVNDSRLALTSRTILENPDGFVKGELYRILDEKALQKVDAYERYYECDPKNSLYERKIMTTIDLDKDKEFLAYVYVYKKNTSKRQRIPEGAWDNRFDRPANRAKAMHG